MAQAPDTDTLAAVRAHVDAAHAAAERLVREADASARARAEAMPPQGWDVPRPAGDGGGGGAGLVAELRAIAGLVELLRGSLPPDVARPLLAALRELLIALRALLDHAIERLEPPPGRE